MKWARKDCPTCKGTGVAQDVYILGDGFPMYVDTPCRNCEEVDHAARSE